MGTISTRPVDIPVLPTRTGSHDMANRRKLAEPGEELELLADILSAHLRTENWNSLPGKMHYDLGRPFKEINRQAVAHEVPIDRRR